MNKAINSIAIKYKYMKDILQERFFQLLLECSQRKVSVTEFTEAIEEGLRSIGRTVSFDPAENLYDRRAKQAR